MCARRCREGDDNALCPCVDRADLAGLNLAQYPAILIELGNMKNGQEAAAMVTAEGRAKYAAVVQGITAYLAQRGS